jgi:hypothetical protein
MLSDHSTFLSSEPVDRNLNAFTLGFWVKDNYGDHAELFVFLKQGSDDQSGTFSLNWYSRLLALEFRDDIRDRFSNTTTPIPEAGIWFHVAVSWSAADRTIRLFLDFEEVGSYLLPSVRILMRYFHFPENFALRSRFLFRFADRDIFMIGSPSYHLYCTRDIFRSLREVDSHGQSTTGWIGSRSVKSPWIKCSSYLKHYQLLTSVSQLRDHFRQLSCPMLSFIGPSNPFHPLRHSTS